MQELMTFNTLMAMQSESMKVFTFTASAQDVKKIAKIQRIAREPDGKLEGFQRPQIAKHIKEIRDYLQKPGSILPNSIVVAFTSGVEILTSANGVGRLKIDISGDDPPGWIVDGQQRFSALIELQDREFEIFITGFICNDEEELHKQFILINNTRPLPKSLIYELLPYVNDLPDRLSSRSVAASLVESLNYREDSSFKNLIKQQTNPYGVIADTSMQKVIMNSLSDGALRIFFREDDFMERSFQLISNFYLAVKTVFAKEWNGHNPRTSRLVHGAGIIGMGYVMETLYALNLSPNTSDFESGLQKLVGKTAWTSGVWDFGHEDQRKWNSVQNVPKDIRQLAQYLVTTLKKEFKKEADAKKTQSG